VAELSASSPAPTTLTPELIAEIRRVSLESTFAFGKFVCGFYDMDPDVHVEMARWVEKPTRLKLGQAPRGFFKTTTWTLSDKLRRATKNPNIRILLTNETAENAEKWIGQLQAIVMSPIYGALFPECVPNPLRVKWNSSQLELKRTKHWPEATFEAIGVGGASTSRHYDIIVNDDLVGKKAREEPTTMQAAIDQRKLAWSLMVDPSKSEIHDFGTRWAPQDLIDWILKNVKGIDHYLVNLRKDDGSSRWPTRFTEAAIEQIRQEQGPEMFALQYLNTAVGSGASKFDPAHLRYWTMTQDAEGNPVLLLESSDGEKAVPLADCAVFQVIDAGLNPESDDARTANVVAALTPPGETTPFDIVILEAKATRSTPYQVLEEAKSTYDHWHPMFAAIETFGGHEAFFYWISEKYPEMRIRKLDKNFSRNAKTKRIIGFWGSYPSQHRVYVSRAHTDLVDELVAFPNGKTVDLLDAAGYLPTIWSPPSGQEKKRKFPPGVTPFDISDDGWEDLTRGPPEDYGSTGYG